MDLFEKSKSFFRGAGELFSNPAALNDYKHTINELLSHVNILECRCREDEKHIDRLTTDLKALKEKEIIRALKDIHVEKGLPFLDLEFYSHEMRRFRAAMANPELSPEDKAALKEPDGLAAIEEIEMGVMPYFRLTYGRMSVAEFFTKVENGAIILQNDNQPEKCESLERVAERDRISCSVPMMEDEFDHEL